MSEGCRSLSQGIGQFLISVDQEVRIKQEIEMEIALCQLAQCDKLFESV